MLLDRLLIQKGTTKEVIQDITFKKGLNLITDATEAEQFSNNIGKSSLLKSLDFCLGGRQGELYGGKDKSHTNAQLENFLKNNSVLFELTISNNSQKHTIARQVVSTKTSSIVIDGVLYSEKKGNKELKKIFFDDIEKPTFRELIHKFIRTTSDALNDPLNFYSKFQTSADRRAIHDRIFFALSNDDIASKNNLEKEKKTLSDRKNQLIKRHDSIDSLKGHVEKLERELLASEEGLELIFKQNAPSQAYKEYEDWAIKRNDALNAVYMLNDDYQNIMQSITRYKSDTVNIDTGMLKVLYAEMKMYNQELHKSFEESIQFHHISTKNRITFLENALQLKLVELEAAQEVLANIRAEGDSLYVKKSKADLALYKDFVNKNKILYEDLEVCIKKLDDWANVLERLESIEKKLKAFSKNNTNLISFNKFFEDYTEEVYREKVYVDSNTEEKPYKLMQLSGVGTGKEKGIITLFDLAYIAFINELDLHAPRFSANDIFEPTDEPTISKIFTIANSLEGQLIIPVLRSKVKFYENYEENIILELNQHRKFFGF